MADRVTIADIMDSTAPRVRVALRYNGTDITRDIAPYLLSFTHTDHAGSQADEISLTLDSIDELWGGRWYPALTDTITADIVCYDWEYPGQRLALPCGTYHIDDISNDGPPDQLTISAISIPITSGLRRQQRHKAWEKMALKSIATDIANDAGLTLLYEASTNPVYERKDQHEQTNLAFLRETCGSYGFKVKVTATRLVIFDEATYERRAPVYTIDRLTSAYINYQFKQRLADAYRNCSVTYHDKKKGNIASTFTPPNPLPGETLIINERVESQAEAERKARAGLREKNRNAFTAGFTLPYNPHIVGAVTINVANWQPRNNGIYLVDSVTHSVGQSGSTTSTNAHRALGY